MIENPLLQNANESKPIQPHFHIDHDWLFNVRAQFAQELARSIIHCYKWGKCREKYQEAVSLSPQEVVTHACEVADAFFTEIEKRGWLLPVPLYDECVEQLRESAPSPIGFNPKIASG